MATIQPQDQPRKKRTRAKVPKVRTGCKTCKSVTRKTANGMSCKTNLVLQTSPLEMRRSKAVLPSLLERQMDMRWLFAEQP
ncbi:hypothetical protein H9Q73_004606 [Fusarium xylarioides]|nr:hypothetical protein H9Q73_004606 [Fusarium xylarioides]